MKKKRKEKDDLDMETTFADMNVEGFSWYDPHKKKYPNAQKVNVTKKEYWSMVKGAFLAYLPIFLITTIVFIFIVLFAYLWLS